MDESYAALIIDLKGSRKYPDDERSAIQEYWYKITNILNVIFVDAMKFEVDFCGGDQVQGLFYRPEVAYLYYRLFSMCTHPIQTHGGIGVGSCKIQLDGKNTGGQDGIAYHRARAASDSADADIGYPILLNSGDTDHDRIVNSLMGMAAMIALQRTARQNQIMLLTELLYPISERDIPFDRDQRAGEIYGLVMEKSQFDQKFVDKKNMPLDDLGKLREYLSKSKEKKGSTKSKKGKMYFITEGKGRGIPKTLSNILEISRQGLDKGLKEADIFTIRNLSIAALEAMRRI